MISKSTLDFLKKLKKNNNRSWFEKNKHHYLEAKEDIEDTVQHLITEFSKFAPELKELKAKKCVFRIYRDVRFSKDKRPYKANLGAGLNQGGKKVHSPGFYIHFEPGNSFIAGGIWMPEPPELSSIRQEIDYNAKDFLKIIKNNTFKKYFKTLDQDDKLKTVPKGYDKTHPQIEFLKLKSFLVLHHFTDKQIMARSAVKDIAKIAKEIRPLNQFLKKAMD